MSNLVKNMTLKALVNTKTVELMPKTTGDQVYLDDITLLTPKIVEIVAAINAKVKQSVFEESMDQVNAKIDTTNDTHSAYTVTVANLLRDLETELKGYTDDKISLLINGAPTTLDTLKELADAFESNKTVIDALNEAIGTKASQADFNAHATNTNNPHNVTKAQLGLGNVDNTSDADKTVKRALTADTADKATDDAVGNNIVDTYAKKVDITKIVVSQEEPNVFNTNDIWFNVNGQGASGVSANQARVFDTYKEMVANLLVMTSGEMVGGQSILIASVGVPDLWVYEVKSSWASYQYSSETSLVDTLENDGKVQVGYFVLAALETQKVDLTDINNAVDNLRTTMNDNNEELYDRGRAVIIAQTESKTGVIKKIPLNPNGGGYRFFLLMLRDDTYKCCIDQKLIPTSLLSIITSYTVHYNDGIGSLDLFDSNQNIWTLAVSSGDGAAYTIYLYGII